MSSFNLIISPIRVHRDEDTDEDKTEPFVNLNDSIASNSSNSSSSNNGDESLQPSSSAAGIRDEIRNKATNNVKINMHYKSLNPLNVELNITITIPPMNIPSSTIASFLSLAWSW